MQPKLIFIITSLSSVLSSTLYDWCRLSCGEKNIICKKQNVQCGPNGSKCGENIEFGMTENDRKIVVRAHNVLREKLASGDEDLGNTGKAANMNFLNYDMELEFVAECWCNECTYEYDQCKSSLNYAEIGQNMFILRSEDVENRLYVDFWEIVSAWYDYINEYHAGSVYLHSPKTDKYTQVVWAETTKVGCAKITSAVSNYFQLMVCCNYYPKGNIEGALIYKPGEPCSECVYPKKCNADFITLCGEELEPEDIDYPFVWKHVKAESPVMCPSGLFCIYVIINRPF